MRDFWLCFISLFVAVDAFGVLPLFVALTENLERRVVRKIIYQSLITATAVGLGFMLAGPAILTFLGINISDFMIAGGSLLFIISIHNLLTGRMTQRHPDLDSLGAVPIGVPLIVGPAVLTTLLLLRSRLESFGITAAALAVNLVIVGAVFLLSEPLHRALGKAGSKAISKLASLILAGYGVMLFRHGVIEFLKSLAETRGN